MPFRLLMIHAGAILTRITVGDLNGTKLIAEACWPVCALLQRAEQTIKTRTLEWTIRVRIHRGLNSVASLANAQRYSELMEQGVIADTPEMLVNMAIADSEAADGEFLTLGFVEKAEDNINDLELQKEFYSCYQFTYAKYIAKAFELVPRDDPRWLAVTYRYLGVGKDVHLGLAHARVRKIAAQFAPHTLLTEFIQKFNFRNFLRDRGLWVTRQCKFSWVLWRHIHWCIKVTSRWLETGLKAPAR